MAPTVESDENIKYLLLIMKHTEFPKPNYHAVAEEAGINTPANAQRRFKSLVERAGYILLNDKIVVADGNTITPKKTRPKKGEKGTTPTSNKKRKVQETTTEEAEGDGSFVRKEKLNQVRNNRGEDQV